MEPTDVRLTPSSAWIGLRQLGLVLAVLGVVEVAVSGYALMRARCR